MDKIMENEKLVYSIYHRHFRRYPHLKEDLISEGFLALCRAENYFDSEKGKSSTYLGKCIYRAMYRFVMKEQKHLTDVSIDETIDEDENIKMVDTVSDNSNPADIWLAEHSLLQALNSDPKAREIIDLYIQNYTQREIAEKIDISQAHVSRILKKFKQIYMEVIG